MKSIVTNFWANLLFVVLLSGAHLTGKAQNSLRLTNAEINIEWDFADGKWQIRKFEGKTDKGFKTFGTPSGQYSLIYDSIKPLNTPLSIVEEGAVIDFPGKEFHPVLTAYNNSTAAVPLNKAGNYLEFYPRKGYQSNNSVVFEEETKYGLYRTTWTIDDKYPSDILLHISLSILKDGYYSLPTPTISTITQDNLSWGVVPGFFQGNTIQESFPLSYVYAQGLPKDPVLCRESTITTMASIMTNKDRLTMAIIPEPGQDRNPYAINESTHLKHWKIALSHMNHDSQLTPTAYHPVLGEIGSYRKKGDIVEFRVRISLKDADWYSVYKHAIYDIYDLKHSFELKENKKSLVDRLLKQYDYVLDDKTALWNEEEYKGRKIIAQSYQTGVVGADNDAMKNSDIGAVWMLAKLTQDDKLNKTRIPYIRNFKILQQAEKGFFKGAVEGQYYLAKSKRFTEEWGNHFEPVAITYYTMSDLGNILLFEPENKEVKTLLKMEQSVC